MSFFMKYVENSDVADCRSCLRRLSIAHGTAMGYGWLALQTDMFWDKSLIIAVFLVIRNTHTYNV